MPSRQELIDLILDHYDRPRHRGSLPDPDVVSRGVNPGCGDVVTIYVRLGEGERIAGVTFEGAGCTISQAAASMLTEQVLGQTLGDVAAMQPEAVVARLGPEIVGSRLRCAALALNTLQAAAADYRAGRAVRSAAEAQVASF